LDGTDDDDDDDDDDYDDDDDDDDDDEEWEFVCLYSRIGEVVLSLFMIVVVRFVLLQSWVMV
jgi:hypothetical protein